MLLTCASDLKSDLALPCKLLLLHNVADLCLRSEIGFGTAQQSHASKFKMLTDLCRRSEIGWRTALCAGIDSRHSWGYTCPAAGCDCIRIKRIQDSAVSRLKK